MTLRAVAEETLRILANGVYRAPSGASVDLGEALRASVSGTRLYRPEAFDLVHEPGRPQIDVVEESTQSAARRLVQVEGRHDLVLLNYASARSVGGGFIGGAKAQEEDLCRCSGLYAALETQPEYYEKNRALSSPLYTDHVIYSPGVPFFRDESLALLERPYPASVITAPAPNAGEHVRRGGDVGALEETLRRRVGNVLAVARAHGHRTLLLGAWGCGVFENDPHVVAGAFFRWLEDLGGAFDRVVFAVPSGPNHEAFRHRFS